MLPLPARPAGLALSLRRVSKSFASPNGPVLALDNLDLDVRAGEFVSIFGPNGCGKSTLLHILAGILKPDVGTVDFGVSARPGSVGIVFQSHEMSLLPWRTCIDNVTLPLEKDRALTAAQRRARALDLLERLRLDLPLGSYPYQMSGGQKQLTCIARALVAEPPILLLDEPFAALDYQTRLSMQGLLEAIWRELNVTTLFVSHDLDEAMLLADRFLLLTARPGTMAVMIDVPLPRPRDVTLTGSPEFVAVRSVVLRRFVQEVKR